MFHFAKESGLPNLIWRVEALAWRTSSEERS